jgi:hypothetical protein
MQRWYYAQRRAYHAGLLLHDVFPTEPDRDARALGCYSDQARFIGYWDAANPFRPVETNTYASVYQLPTHLAVVLVNNQPQERVVDFVVDAAALRALLETDRVVFADADSGTIPPLDDVVAELKSGMKMKSPDLDGDADATTAALADSLLKEMAAATKKENDPDGFFEHHNFRYENGRLRLRIQGRDYRLLKVTR